MPKPAVVKKKLPVTLPVEILSPRATAALVGLSIDTLRRMWRAGRFPVPVQLSTQRIGFRKTDLDRWLAARPRRYAS